MKNSNKKEKKYFNKENLSQYLIYTIEKYYWIFIIALPIIVYFHSIFFGFINFDDTNIILGLTENPQTATFKYAFSDAYMNFYRPLQTVTFIIENYFAGTSPALYHITNLILHTICSLLVFFLLKDILKNNIKSFLGSIIFSIHPLFVHTVIWIPSRGDLLLCLFGLLNFIFFIKYTKTNNLKFLIFNVLAFGLAILSKETAVIFPILIYFYFFFLNTNSKNYKQLILSTIGWVIFLGIWYYLRSIAIYGGLDSNVMGITSFVKNIRIIPEVISKFILPLKLQVAPTFSIYNTFAGIFLIIFFIISTFLLKNKSLKLIIFGGIWFFLLLIPVLIFRLPHADNYFDYLEHRAYLPAIGLLISILTLIPDKYFNFNNLKNIIPFIILFIFLITINIVHSRNYSNGIKYWKSAVKENPERSYFYNGVGLSYNRINRADLAEKYFLKAFKLQPDNNTTNTALGEFYYNQKDLNKAIFFFNNSQINEPESEKSNINLAIALIESGNTSMAIKYLQNANKINPLNKPVLFNLIDLSKQLQDYENTIIYANKLKQLGERIDISDIYVDWAISLLKNNQTEKARSILNQSININPKNPRAIELISR